MLSFDLKWHIPPVSELAAMKHTLEANVHHKTSYLCGWYGQCCGGSIKEQRAKL